MRRTDHVIGWMALLLLFAVMPVRGQTSTPEQAPTPQTDSAPAELGKNQPANGVYRVGGRVSPPEAIDRADPQYSERARMEGYGGVCDLSLVVDANGEPRDIKVTRALGLGLDEKAIEAVSKWKFSPAMKDGVPVAVRITVEVSFHVYNEGKLTTLLEKADAGNAKAQFEVSQIFLAENDAYDDARGLPYLDKAARQAFPKAQFEMGNYLSSRGNDLVSAYVWYSLAERDHSKDSGKKLKELAEKMTPDQLAEARRRAESGNLPAETKPRLP